MIWLDIQSHFKQYRIYAFLLRKVEKVITHVNGETKKDEILSLIQIPGKES